MTITFRIILFFLLILTSWSRANPFAISFPEKKDLSNEDYIEIQNEIRQIDIAFLLKSLYVNAPGFTSFEDFYGRCIKGIRQTLICPEKGLYPIKALEKIGEGGSNCVVCSVPFGGKYPQYVTSIVQGLKEQGFNGYFLYYIGGWPNPTGREIKYVAVPYSFKIFAMVEAYQLGFKNVLWIDSACYPIRDINPLFHFISSQGALLNHFPMPSDSWGFILPATAALLKIITGTDVYDKDCHFVNTIVFGINMETPEAQKLVERYYQCVDLGTPFLSCFPEEWVLTAIIGLPEFQHWRTKYVPMLVQGSLTNADDSPEEFELARQRGVYFYHRKGR